MRPLDPKVTLRQIADYARLAQQLCALDQSPVIMEWQKVAAFELVGEAAKRLPPELCRDYPTVDWGFIAGMRERIRRSCFGADYEGLWQPVQKDIPALLDTVEQMLQDLESSESNRPT